MLMRLNVERKRYLPVFDMLCSGRMKNRAKSRRYNCGSPSQRRTNGACFLVIAQNRSRDIANGIERKTARR